MAAGVHDAGLHPGAARAAQLAGIREAGLLLDRERVHVGAKHDDWAWSVLPHRDDPGLADAFGDLEAHLLRICSEFRGSARLVPRELGVRVEILVEGDTRDR